MPLTAEGLVVQTFQEVLDDIILAEQDNVSSQIDVNDDTALGETNKIMAAEIATTNQGVQDVYDQRNINNAEGKALDDNVSWLGITRQDAAATGGEALFTGINNTVITSGSQVQNDATQAIYAVDNIFTITATSCRSFKSKIIDVAEGTFTVTVGRVPL